MPASDYTPTFSEVTGGNEFLGKNQWNAVYTIQLGELIEHDVFKWDLPILDWKDAAYSDDQYERVCSYFIERFRFREISIEPFYEWATMLKRKLVFELMPKFRPLYKELDEGFDPFQVSDKYHKERTVGSDYPETLLSGNSDYASTGKDSEHEDSERGDMQRLYNSYIEGFHAIDEKLLDGLESMFIGLYTASIDGM